MEIETKSINPDDIKRLIEDVALIKKVLSIDKIDSEGELTDWAKEELQKARLEKEVTSHEELKKELGL